MRRILFVSGKGGTGKTTVATSVALALGRSHEVAFLDADLEKPSAHLVFGTGRVEIIRDRFVPPRVRGVQFMSNALIFPGAGSLLWPRKREEQAACQLLRLTDFDADFLLIDTPPGTPPALQGLLREPMDGAVVVTTPAPLDLDGARRGLGLLRERRVPLLGVILNRCTDLRLPEPGGGEVRWEIGGPRTRVKLPVLGRIPEDSRVRQRMTIGGVEPIAERVVNQKPLRWRDRTIGQRLRRAAVKFALGR